jgi:predicted nucleic acid-binding protein
MRDGDQELLERYDALFGASRVAVLDVSSKVIARATELRARYGFKSPGAIHLATAIEYAASEFWTADARLARCTDVVVTVLVSST